MYDRRLPTAVCDAASPARSPYTPRFVQVALKMYF